MATQTAEPAPQITAGKKRKREKKARPKRSLLARLFRFAFFMAFLGALAVGGVYMALKFGILKPPPKVAQHPLYAKLGLKRPGIPARTASAPPPDPLAGERKLLKAQRDALQQERAEWEKQKQEEADRMKELEEKRKAALIAPPKPAIDPNALDPKGVARLAAIYEEMPTKDVSKIFAILPDNQIIALLKRMDEKKVAEILAAEKPARAARFSATLAKPQPETASRPL